MPITTLPNSFARAWGQCGIHVNFAGIDQSEGGHERHRRGKAWWTFNLVMLGRLRIMTARDVLAVVGPAAYLVPPQTPYREIAEQQHLEQFTAGFFLDLGKCLFNPLLALPLPQMVAIADLAGWRTYCHEATSCFRSYRSIDFAHNVHARLPMDRLLNLYLTSLPWDKIACRDSDQSIPPWISDLRDRILKNLSKPELDFPAILTWSGFTAAHVHHAFKRYYGVSPMHLVRDERMRLAARHLENNPVESIATLARAYGYKDASLFTRHFTAKFRVPPRAYRAGRPGGTVDRSV